MFHLRKRSLDDLMRGTYLHLLSKAGTEVVSSKGRSIETFGTALELTNPRCRLSRSIGRSRVYSALGEFLWYASGSNSIKQIEYYIPKYSDFSDDSDKSTAYGAYGPRIFNKVDGHDVSQWEKVIGRLASTETRETRNAVISIASAQDFLTKTKDRPCTCTLQFVVRRNQLHLHAHMRSNDAYWGMPHDFFSFTMLQELAASQIGVGLGRYIHSVGSLHIYADPKAQDHRQQAQSYLDEGLYSYRAMPPMPKGDQWPNLQLLLQAEKEIREGNLDFLVWQGLPEYWEDMVTLLRVYACAKHMTGAKARERDEAMRRYLQGLHNKEYELYVRDRLEVDEQLRDPETGAGAKK